MSNLEDIPLTMCVSLLRRLSDFGLTEDELAVILESDGAAEQLVARWHELAKKPDTHSSDEIQPTSVRTLGLGAGTTNALLRARIASLADLVSLTSEELDEKPLIGPRRVQAIETALQARNLSLRR